ncbi:hypothetical protein [Chryseobacterium sp. SG20098]|uniref:hypothetical protein n=1 Tax=Chryseobacterium sp. SG20098 TaxID=3074145 RepID=UPI00288347F4|nr:hypothetical protein [Chryseobacterium sp. SG20098]WNI39064.1 hypothetical protein RHP76_11310 [Chryseobacterium sp. SG20098]
MKKHNIFFALILPLISFAQDVKFKKSKALIDGKESFNIEKIGTFGAVGYDISPLDSNKPFLSLISNDGGTHMELSDDYVIIRFLTVGKNLEISGGDTRKALKLLLKNEVIIDGKLDESKIDIFISNYDENISNRTVIRR